jgi:diguanylate cyclase (GGDEF)-like protein
VGDLIYPLGDVLLVAFTVAVLAITGWRPGRTLAFVSAGLAISSIADVLSLYWSATGHSGSSVFDSLWPAGAAVLGWGAWQPARPAAAMTLHGRRLLVFPLGFVLVALGLLALQQAQPLHAAAYVLALTTVGGAVARMAVTFTENLRLVDRSRHEALSDPLTGLGNRRALLLALEDALQSASARAPWALLIFDLNGFKRYNDAFGHPAGDALLARLGGKLRAAAAPGGRAYRLGGDEFCVLARVGPASAVPSLEALTTTTITALAEEGPGFAITAACGQIVLPDEAQDASAALRLADQRLYADKRSRPASDAPDQLRSVLLQVLAEHQPDLPEYLEEVAVAARAIGVQMGLTGEDLEVVVRAAELHDVGKVAVPDAILNKPAALSPEERTIVERHAQVGERILSAAPAMTPVARLVRASHERYDGSGYPDRRRGAEIPLGARIIAVCDAFHAMTSDRPYRAALEASKAIAELRRCSGTQFDPEVVEVFCAEWTSGGLQRLQPDADPLAEHEAG